MSSCTCKGNDYDRIVDIGAKKSKDVPKCND